MESQLKFYLDPVVKAKGIKFDVPRLGDAGFDLRSSEDVVLQPAQQCMVHTGLKLAIPLGWVGIVKDRSSMALKRVYTHAGVIDAAYRGEICIVLSNQGESTYHIEAGAKIAQLVLIPCSTSATEVLSLDELGETERGQGGFGSTGVK